MTGVRFFAALAVFNFHYLLPERWPVRVPGVLLSVVGSGNAGVTLFFMLSGFILAYTNSGWAASRDETARFWANRIARIYPTYLLAMIWFAPFFLVHRFATEPPGVAAAKSVASFLPALFLVQSWFHPRFATAWNGPAWTLSVEAAFYLLFPFCAAGVRRLPQSRKLLLCLACWITTVLLTRVDPVLLASTPAREEFFTYNPLCHLPTFISGVALGYHFLQRRGTGHGTTLALCGAIAVIAVAGVARWLPFRFAFEAAFLPGFGALLYGLAMGGWPARALSVRPLVLLGESSYALYLLQFSIAFTVVWIENRFVLRDFMELGRPHPRLPTPSFYAVELLVAVIVSLAVWRYYETPLRRILRPALYRMLAGRRLHGSGRPEAC